MNLPIRQMTPEGVAQFQQWILEGAVGPLPRHILVSDECATFMSPQVTIDTSKNFPNKLQLAIYLKSKLEPYNLASLDYSHGVWTWLSAAYFDILAPIDASGSRKNLSTEAGCPAYIWRPDAANFGRKFYRHRVGFSVKVLDTLGVDDAAPLLDSVPGKLSSYCEHNYARQGSGIEFTLAIRLANKLFWNGHKLKANCTKNVRGSVIHMHRWISQLSVNYDVTKMTLSELIAMLPPELKR
jgi:hypothetical protein